MFKSVKKTFIFTIIICSFFSCQSQDPASSATVGPGTFRPDTTTTTTTSTTTTSTTESSSTSTTGTDTTTTGTDTTTSQSGEFPEVPEISKAELRANFEELKVQYPKEMSYYVEKFGFTDSGETTLLSSTEETSLKFYIEQVSPVIHKLGDIQLLAWWLLNKKVFQLDPYKLNKCDHAYVAADAECTTTDTSGWVVGYDVKVLNFLNEKLYTAYKSFYGDPMVSDVLSPIISKAGLSATPDFKASTIEEVVKDSIENLPSKSKAGKSIRFWASMLMRDPKIGAQLSILFVNEFNCFGKLKGDTSIPAAWCANEEKITEDKKALYSDQMKRVINSWNALKNSLICPYN